ncbi:hypothetical protein [Shinella sp. JR1-6]|uniref:hypothetical protein n=1 Tax=Shinella sp. JR1-6 TaxID=2527671 RepID=UPI00102D5DD2|nr:hypothetical protein [Shinella sp. JR1-6]TAA54622.1 hypothetical protein EXZ48_26720 [Shinella sp. JR1-6]
MAKATPRAKPARPTKAAPKISVADQMVNQTEMAKILDISTRFLRQLQVDGVLQPEKGKFRVGSTVRAYADFLKQGSEKRSGSSSMDELRAEKALDIRLNRARKDREIISLDEALSAIDEVTGLYVSSLSGLPAQITGVPRERQRLDEIFDRERLRIRDRLAKKRQALLEGRETSDTEAEDDAD